MGHEPMMHQNRLRLAHQRSATYVVAVAYKTHSILFLIYFPLNYTIALLYKVHYCTYSTSMTLRKIRSSWQILRLIKLQSHTRSIYNFPLMHYGPEAIVRCMHDYTLYPYEPMKDKRTSRSWEWWWSNHQILDR